MIRLFVWEKMEDEFDPSYHPLLGAGAAGNAQAWKNAVRRSCRAWHQIDQAREACGDDAEAIHIWLIAHDVEDAERASISIIQDTLDHWDEFHPRGRGNLVRFMPKYLKTSSPTSKPRGMLFSVKRQQKHQHGEVDGMVERILKSLDERRTAIFLEGLSIGLPKARALFQALQTPKDSGGAAGAAAGGSY